MTARPLRCAVYTRKSSEEGLEQAFNSLDAQREAGLDFIRSQKHQGWVAIDAAFDDGGYSGGTTERPSLKRLLAEIDAGRVDVVVVYKVDRLSRSLADFARLMQLFDERRVSFVSVTQQFNTTTSMGRLTLNMLLSFAQFEREVAGERVRDKIAATKRKGVWVCGQPPLGYRLPREGEDRRLRIVDLEAAIVRLAFDEYIKAGSLLAVATRLNALGRTTRRWTSSRGIAHGGRPFTPTLIHRMLTNPVYLGKITHTRRTPGGPAGSPEVRTEIYDGLHVPIIGRDVWDKAQARMARIDREAGSRWTHTHLLKGKLRTFEGWAMSPASVPRPVTKGGHDTGERRTVRYYVSQKACKQGSKTCPIKRINAERLDDLVRSLVIDHARLRRGVEPPSKDPAIRDRWVREVVERVLLAPDLITIELASDRLAAGADEQTRVRASDPEGPGCGYTPDVTDDGQLTVLTLRMRIRRLSGRHALISPDGHDLLTYAGGDGKPAARKNLLHAIGLAYAWRGALMRSGGTVEEVATRSGVAKARVYTLLPLTQLGPVALRAILSGEHPRSMTLKDVLAAAGQLDWSRQAAMLKLAPQSASGRARRTA